MPKTGRLGLRGSSSAIAILLLPQYALVSRLWRCGPCDELVQPKYSSGNASPDGSEIIMLERPMASPCRDNSTIVPQPVKVAPAKENPSTMVSLADIVKPCDSDSPPEALTTVAPSTVN